MSLEPAMNNPSRGDGPPSYPPSAPDGGFETLKEQLTARGIRDARVLAAMMAVPRERFLPPELQPQAYQDLPLPIGCGQTLSQPYLVAYMAEVLALSPGDRVLEVGAGSGYLAAVLSHLAAQVCAVELEPDLWTRARAALGRLGRSNVLLRCGNGAQGWPERAPFDAILFSCAAPAPPPEPWRQLKPGGRLLMPMGEPGGPQQLMLLRKTAQGAQASPLIPVSFVPLRRSPGDQ